MTNTGRRKMALKSCLWFLVAVAIVVKTTSACSYSAVMPCFKILDGISSDYCGVATQAYSCFLGLPSECSQNPGYDKMMSSIKTMMKSACKTQIYTVRVVRNRPGYFARKLYHSMKGMGTDDRTLIRIIITRAEVDMVQIKQEFQKQFGKSLDGFIRDDTSGDYRKVLLALVSQGGY